MIISFNLSRQLQHEPQHKSTHTHKNTRTQIIDTHTHFRVIHEIQDHGIQDHRIKIVPKNEPD